MKDGILYIDKDKGLTSRYVDNRLQKFFQKEKVGHLGTLDPFATGLLIVAVGRATKYLPYLADGKKGYIASLRLGYSSTSGDPDGEISSDSHPIPKLTAESIVLALSSFRGKRTQIPPMTSAIKIDGVPLYKKARKGETVERKPREIEIYEIRLLNFGPDFIDFSCLVSKGTYIRTLGEDIAKRLGTSGYLTTLRRVSVGPVSLAKAKKLEDVSEADFHDPSTMMGNFPQIELDQKENEKAQNGVALPFANHSEERLYLTYQGTGVAMYVRSPDGLYHCERGLR